MKKLINLLKEEGRVLFTTNDGSDILATRGIQVQLLCLAILPIMIQ